MQFTGTDKSEIARNSVLTSGFEHYWKKKWLGENYTLANQVDANTQDKSNVSDIRTSFRHSNLMRELHYVAHRANVLGELPQKLSHSDSSVENKIKDSAHRDLGSTKDNTKGDDSRVRFVHLAGHSILMADSLFRGVNRTAIRAGQIAMRDSIDKEGESAKDLLQVSQDQDRVVDSVHEADEDVVNKPPVQFGQKNLADAVSSEIETIHMGYGSSATGMSGVTPAQVKNFVSRRNRFSQASQ